MQTLIIFYSFQELFINALICSVKAVNYELVAQMWAISQNFEIKYNGICVYIAEIQSQEVYTYNLLYILMELVYK